MPAPSFDLARTIEDPVAWADGALEVASGAAAADAAGTRRAAPLDRAPPALLWAGLVVVVFALGALTLQALRSQH